MSKVTINGKEVEATQLSFTPFTEPFAEYHLEDGSIARVKVCLLKIYRLQEKGPDGNSQYFINQNVMLVVDEKS